MHMNPSLRFDVVLDKTNLENYEVSFLDLIEKIKHKARDDLNHIEFDNMERLVKQMEEKYGPVAYAKGKRIRVNDFVDMGDGYDMTDDFIDDEEEDEAYIVAPDLMTEHGGFFINRAKLKLSEVDIEFVGEITKKQSKRKTSGNKNVSTKSKSQQLLNQARKRLITTKTSSKLNKVKTSNKKLSALFKDILSSNEIVVFDKVESVNETDMKQSVNDAIMPVQDAQITNNDCSTTSQSKPVSLPIGLPESVLDKIQTLMEICEKSKRESSKIPLQFNCILFDLDSLLISTYQKGLKGIRSNVMRYVSQSTDIKYEALLRRISKFKESRKRDEVKFVYEEFENAINDAMTDSMTKYNNDMKQYIIKVDAQKLELQNAELPLEQSQEGDVLPKNKAVNKMRLPKRTFSWTTTCKSLLHKLTNGEIDLYRVSNNTLPIEEHLNKFYQASIITLFPSKWMTISQLMKMSLPLITAFKQSLMTGEELVGKQNPDIKQIHTQNGNNSLSPNEGAKPLINNTSFIDLTESNDIILNNQLKPSKPAKKSVTVKPFVSPGAITESGNVIDMSPSVTQKLSQSRKRKSNAVSSIMSHGTTFNELPSSTGHSPSKQVCLTNISNISMSNNFVPNYFQHSSPVQYNHQQFYNNGLMHSTPSNIVSENGLRIHSRSQNLSMLSPITNQKFGNTDSYPSITITNINTPTYHSNIRRSYTSLYPVYQSSPKSIYNPKTSTRKQVFVIKSESP